MSQKSPQRKPMHRCVGTVGVITILTWGIETALAADFLEPPVFTSQNGVLNILMVAKAKPIPTISFTPPTGGSAINPIGWAYEICQRPATGSSCPTGTGTVWDYGGVRLALQQGDTLNIHFVNQLPKVDANKLNHVTDPGEANLFLNPTNLHTHGLLTPARAATRGDQTGCSGTIRTRMAWRSIKWSKAWPALSRSAVSATSPKAMSAMCRFRTPTSDT